MQYLAIFAIVNVNKTLESQLKRANARPAVV